MSKTVLATPAGEKGFTLLEVIVVAFILAVIAGTIVVNIQPREEQDDAQTAAVVFREKLHHARQMALIRNWVIGLQVDDHEYRFYRWHNERWRGITEPALAPTRLSRDIELELLVGDFALVDNIIDGDRSAVFRSDRDDRDEDEMRQPDIFIFESSDFVPFALGFHGIFSGYSYWVNGFDGLHLELQDYEP